MVTPLESMFNGEEPKTEAPAEPVEETTETVEEPKVEEPKGEEPEKEPEPEPKEEPEAEPPAAKQTKEVPLAALLDERDKRKAAEQRATELEQAQTEKTDAPDFWDNPEQAIAKATENLEAKFEAKLQERMLRFSIKGAEGRHDDYNSAFDSFKQAVEENPALADIAASADDPGEEIYRIGKSVLQLDEAGGDIGAMREKIREEERQKILDEIKEKEDKLSKVPQSLTDEQSATAPRDPVEGGPTPLTSILKRN